MTNNDLQYLPGIQADVDTFIRTGPVRVEDTVSDISITGGDPTRTRETNFVEEAGRSAESVLAEALREALSAPTDLQTEVLSEDGSGQEQHTHRRHRKGENVTPTPLQRQYQRQVRDGRAARPELVDNMARLAAWTWIPGKDRKACPPIVDLRDARLMVMDRFPAELDGPCDRIALSMYRSAITKQGCVSYASPANIEMFKDFSIRPHFRAGGLCLDSRNEDVLRTALALDQAIELVARGKLDPVQTFVPPPVLFGFPRHYVPTVEWQTPMMEAVCKVLHPEAPVLKCLQSPGGTVTSIISERNDTKTIVMEQSGRRINIRVPSWLAILPHTQPGSQVAAGVPLADLRRGVYSIEEMKKAHPFPVLLWLEHRIMEELTEVISVNEEVYDKQTKARRAITTTWCCVPSQFVVQTQVGRAVRFFLDFRQHLGRRKHTIDLNENDVWSTDNHQARIDVCAFPSRPTVKDLQFSDSEDEKKRMWHADLMTAPDGAVWSPRCPLRGVADLTAA